MIDSVTGANYLHPNLGRGKRAEFAFFKSPPVLAPIAVLALNAVLAPIAVRACVVCV
jgi:hypothetical protein